MSSKWWLFVAALAMLGFARPCLGAEPLAPKILFDFESDDDLVKFTKSGVTATLVAEHATHGTKAAKLVYQPGEDLRTFMFSAGRDKLNLAGYTHLVLDVFSPAAASIVVKLKSNDEAAKWQKEMKLEAGDNKIAIAFETAGIDPAKLDYINLFAGGLAAEMVLFVDNIRAEVAGAPQPAAAGATGDKLIFDFETREELAQWELNGATAELSTDHVTHGKHSAMVVYKPGKGLQTFMVNAGRKKIDLSGCTHLYLDFFAPVNMAITVKIKSNDGSKKWQREYNLEPEASSITVPFEGSDLDPAKLDQINLFTGELGVETIIYLDNIRGVNMKGGGGPSKPAKPELPDEELF